MTSVSPGTSARSARSARCTIPSASQAPEPSSSFSSGIPKRSTARTPSDASSRRLADELVDRALRDPLEPGDGRTTPSPGQAKSGITTSSSERRVSRTRARSVSVRRRRRRRVTGNPVIRARVRQRGCRAAPPRRPRRATPVVVPGVEADAARRRTPRSPGGGHRRQREQDAGDAVQLTAREQPEDDEQRVEAERVRHHVRHDDVALDLVDEDEERQHPERRDRVDDERVDHGRDGREPRADVRDHLDHRRPDAEEQRVPLGARHEPRASRAPTSRSRR